MRPRPFSRRVTITITLTQWNHYNEAVEVTVSAVKSAGMTRLLYADQWTPRRLADLQELTQCLSMVLEGQILEEWPAAIPLDAFYDIDQVPTDPNAG